MIIVATILIGALSIGTNGHVEFIDYDDGWRAVDSEYIAGSEDWYTETESILTPKMWRVWRNGHVVTNSFAAPPLHTHIPIELHFVPPSPTYAGVDLSDWHSYIDINDDYNRRAVRNPGESDPDPSVVSFFPGIAGITWNSHAGPTNFHYRAYPIEFDTNSVDEVYADRKIFMPRAPRLSQTSRDSLVSTFDAYFERLYYASQGNKNDWDEDDWGTTSSGPDFEFSPTNVYIATTPRFDIMYPGSETNAHRRQIDQSIRLLDAPNIRRLVANMKDLFPACIKVEPVPMPAVIPPHGVMDARPFVFRPHWLTDPRDFPRGDSYGSSLWWGSSAPYPIVTQFVYRAEGSTNIVAVIPDPEDLDVIFPTFDWTELAQKDEFEAIDWCLHSIVLDMAIPDTMTFITRGQQTPIPCVELFMALDSMDVGASPIQQQLWKIKTYDTGCTVLGLLTNAFPRAAKTLPNEEKAFARYRDGILDEAGSLRLTTTEIAIANQLFAVMDRTVHIPSMDIVTTNVRRRIERDGTYEGQGDPVKAEFELVDGELVLVGHPDGISFDIDLKGEQDNESTNRIVRNSIHAEATTPDFRIIPGIDLGQYGFGGDIYFNGEGDFVPGTNVVAGIVPDPRNGLRLDLVDNYGVTIGIAHAKEGELLEAEIAPPEYVQANRTYFYEDPREADGSVQFGTTQPGADATSHGGMLESEYVNLDRLFESWSEPDCGDGPSNTLYRWRSEGGKSYYDRDDLCSSAGSGALSQCKDDLYDLMRNRISYDPDDPSSYAPFPDSTTITGDVTCGPLNATSIADDYPFVEKRQVEYWDLYFDIPDFIDIYAYFEYSQPATRDATNVFDVVENYYVQTNGEVVTELATTNTWGKEEGEVVYGERILYNDPVFAYTNMVVFKSITYDKEEIFHFSSAIHSNVYESTLYDDCKERLYGLYRIVKHTRYEDPEKDPETERLTNTTYNGEFDFHLDPDESHYENLHEEPITLGFDDASRVVTNTTEYSIFKYLEIAADDHGNFQSASLRWIDPETAEECSESVQLPLHVGRWVASPALYFNPRYSDDGYDVSGEKGYFSGDIIFRTMTRTTWPWNAMHLERNNQ